MASGGHLLLQRKPNIEARIKIQVNNALKDICKYNNRAVSGTKVVLQQRCQHILDDIVSRGDVKQFDDFHFMVSHNGQRPPSQQSCSPANTYPAPGGNSNYNMPSHRGPNGIPGNSHLNPSGKYFKPSPFYEITATVLPLAVIPDGPEMPQNRHTVRSSITLSAEQARQLEEPDMRLLLYCGDHTKISLYHPIDIAFPNQIEVKINGDEIKHNFKGLKNKAGSTKPANVTNSLRKKAGYSNQISITYALTAKRYAYVVHMARYVSPDALAERLRTANVIPKQRVLDEMIQANADADVAATSVRMSLKDPVSTVRITLPVRSTVCSHNQCFDGAMFLQLQEQAPQWTCPVCNKNVSFQSLSVDKYFEDILQNTSKSIDKVDIEPTGEWKVIQEEEEQANGATNKSRTSQDYDSDDDLVDVTEAVNKPLNGLKRNSNKRPASAIIDLTLSDDEDEPPRSAQRQRMSATSAPHRNASSSYNTPSSTTDSTSYPLFQNLQADTYRPASREPHRSTFAAGAAPTSPQSFRLAPPQSPSNTQSPARNPSTSSFGNLNSNSNANWAAQHSHPPSGAFTFDHVGSPFANLGPMSQDARSPSQLQPSPRLPQLPQSALRLPPMLRQSSAE